MLPEAVTAVVEAVIGPIRSTVSVGGGCIANATRLRTANGDFFLKWSDATAALAFEAEAAGLEALRTASSPLRVPEVVLVQPGVLILEWLERGAGGPGFWQDFGRGLAALHRETSDRFGFHGDNFIGRLPQQNEWKHTWPEFFRECRLQPQVRMAREGGRWRSSWDPLLDRLLRHLDTLLPQHPPPSILHGDLWSGNYLITRDATAALVDPAAYYGDRETDLAMTELFGGFDGRFYDAYKEAWPLEPGYEERRVVYNLYHLINHLNHFGEGYAGAVEGCLRNSE